MLSIKYSSSKWTPFACPFLVGSYLIAMALRGVSTGIRNILSLAIL
jgi:hypothetical protein